MHSRLLVPDPPLSATIVSQIGTQCRVDLSAVVVLELRWECVNCECKEEPKATESIQVPTALLLHALGLPGQLRCDLDSGRQFDRSRAFFLSYPTISPLGVEQRLLSHKFLANSKR